MHGRESDGIFKQTRKIRYKGHQNVTAQHRESEVVISKELIYLGFVCTLNLDTEYQMSFGWVSFSVLNTTVAMLIFSWPFRSTLWILLELV